MKKLSLQVYFNSTEILHQATNYSKRLFLELYEIKKLKNSINYRVDIVNLSDFLNNSKHLGHAVTFVS